MSQTPMGVPPLGYQVAGGWQGRDEGHLTALSICHYVLGGITIVFSSIFIIYIAIGSVMASGNFPIVPPASSAGSPMTQPGAAAAAASITQTMTFAGRMLIVVGSCFVAIGWTIGILTIVSGVCIARRRRRIFSLVMAGVCCLMMPLGTILGIFTILVLVRDSVKWMYQARVA
jgi:hypothetical protein